VYDWLSEVSRIMKFHMDYSEESHHDTLVRNPSIQLSLSIQNAMGYNGDAHPRSFGAKISWISLQVRNCVVLMTMAASLKVPDPENIPNRISGLEDAGKSGHNIM
jgi:mediator of RNA polymerase II transcription subunit 16